MPFIKTIFIISVLFLSRFVPNYATSVEDCVLSEEIECYYCDSHHNEHCGNPFEFSHYYVSTEIYLISCYGCCTKMVHPLENGDRRIIRSCVENYPHLNITLNDDCNSPEENNRQVCLCSENLCNAAHQKFSCLNTFISIFLLKFLLLLLC